MAANREFPVPDFFVKTLTVTSAIAGLSTNPLNVGTGSTSHSLNSSNDLFVTGDFEVDGSSYFDSTLVMGGAVDMTNATNIGSIRMKNTSQTVDCMSFSPGSINNYLLVCEFGDVAFDFSHAQQTNPTLYIHSANQATDEWISITHDQTDGVIDCGTGTLNLGATGNVNFAGATHTGTGDTVTNGHVTMEVAGASIKFATVA